MLADDGWNQCDISTERQHNIALSTCRKRVRAADCGYQLDTKAERQTADMASNVDRHNEKPMTAASNATRKQRQTADMASHVSGWRLESMRDQHRETTQRCIIDVS